MTASELRSMVKMLDQHNYPDKASVNWLLYSVGAFRGFRRSMHTLNVTQVGLVIKTLVPHAGKPTMNYETNLYDGSGAPAKRWDNYRQFGWWRESQEEIIELVKPIFPIGLFFRFVPAKQKGKQGWSVVFYTTMDVFPSAFFGDGSLENGIARNTVLATRQREHKQIKEVEARLDKETVR